MKYLLRSGVFLVVIFCFILINLKAQSPESPEPETSPSKSDEDSRKIRDQKSFLTFQKGYSDLSIIANDPELGELTIPLAEGILLDLERAILSDDLLNSKRTKLLRSNFISILKKTKQGVASLERVNTIIAVFKKSKIAEREKESIEAERPEKAKQERLRSVSGYKDIKFGMTIDDIKDLGVCSYWTESLCTPSKSATCYEIGGERRHFIFDVPKYGKGGNNGIHQIQIDLGTYTFESFNKLSNTIGKKYKKVFSHVLDDGHALVCFNDNKIALRSSLTRSKHPTKEGCILEKKMFVIYNDGPNKTCKMFAPADVSSDDF